MFHCQRWLNEMDSEMLLFQDCSLKVHFNNMEFSKSAIENRKWSNWVYLSLSRTVYPHWTQRWRKPLWTVQAFKQEAIFPSYSYEASLLFIRCSMPRGISSLLKSLHGCRVTDTRNGMLAAFVVLLPQRFRTTFRFSGFDLRFTAIPKRLARISFNSFDMHC